MRSVIDPNFGSLRRLVILSGITLFYIHRVSSAFAHGDGIVTFSFSNGCALWSRNKINRGTRGEHGRSSPSNPENRYIRSVTRSAVLLALCHSESRCQRSQTSRSDQRCARSRVRFSSWYDGPLACRQELWSSASFTPDHMAEGCSVPDHRERDAGSPRCSRVPLESQLAMVSSQEAWGGAGAIAAFGSYGQLKQR